MIVVTVHFLLAFGLARVMVALGPVDVPGGRKAHARPTPKAGGIAIIATCVAMTGAFSTFYNGETTIGLAAALCLGAVGLLDDLREMSATRKLIAQVLAAILAVHWGPDLPFGGGPMIQGLAIVGLVFLTNAFNFMDGLDGLAGSVGLVAAGTIACLAPAAGPAQMLALALALGLAGFLPFNWHPAQLFLGDTGSQFCGFLLGLLGLWLAAETREAASLALVPMLLLGLIGDVLVTLAARVAAGARLTSGHREHLYQRARLRPACVALAHAGFAALGGIAWIIGAGGHPWAGLVLVGLPQIAWLSLLPATPRPRRSVRIPARSC